MEVVSLALNAKVVGEVAVVGQICWVNPCRSRMISIVASVASALVSSFLAKHVVPSGASNFMVTVGVNVVVSFCEQLTAILNLLAFTRALPEAGKASGLALPNERLEGTDKLQVDRGDGSGDTELRLLSRKTTYMPLEESCSSSKPTWINACKGLIP